MAENMADMADKWQKIGKVHADDMEVANVLF